jgi:hypothetical protein
MHTFVVIMLLLAGVAFLIAAVGTPPVPKVNLVALGLFLWVVAVLVPIL